MDFDENITRALRILEPMAHFCRHHETLAQNNRDVKHGFFWHLGEQAIMRAISNLESAADLAMLVAKEN